MPSDRHASQPRHSQTISKDLTVNDCREPSCPGFWWISPHGHKVNDLSLGQSMAPIVLHAAHPRKIRPTFSHSSCSIFPQPDSSGTAHVLPSKGQDTLPDLYTRACESETRDSRTLLDSIVPVSVHACIEFVFGFPILPPVCPSSWLQTLGSSTLSTPSCESSTWALPQYPMGHAVT